MKAGTPSRRTLLDPARRARVFAAATSPTTSTGSGDGGGPACIAALEAEKFLTDSPPDPAARGGEEARQ